MKFVAEDFKFLTDKIYIQELSFNKPKLKQGLNYLFTFSKKHLKGLKVEFIEEYTAELKNYNRGDINKNISKYTKFLLFVYTMLKLPKSYIMELLENSKIKVFLPIIKFFTDTWFRYTIMGVFKALTPRAFVDFVLQFFTFIFKCLPSLLWNAIKYLFDLIIGVFNTILKFTKRKKKTESYYKNGYISESLFGNILEKIKEQVKKIVGKGLQYLAIIIDKIANIFKKILFPIQKCVENKYKSSYGMALMYQIGKIMATSSAITLLGAANVTLATTFLGVLSFVFTFVGMMAMIAMFAGLGSNILEMFAVSMQGGF